jgi:hypothetical protein
MAKPEQSAAEEAQEIARLRARVAELEARTPAAPTTGAITDQEEIDAGVDESGRQMWFYKINLPSSGGWDVSINGTRFYHGQQYKIGTDTLRTLKEIVHRSWQHENAIMGNNENFYRRPQERVLRGDKR